MFNVMLSPAPGHSGFQEPGGEVLSHRSLPSCVCFRPALAHLLKHCENVVVRPGSKMHYLHHSKFDCNFGSSIFPLDALFGTFRAE